MVLPVVHLLLLIRIIKVNGFSSLQAGLISITYLVAVLIMIRVGEKLLQNLVLKPLLVVVLHS